MNEYLSMLNRANEVLGFFNEEITEQTIGVISNLSEEQQKALFNQLYLIAQQRGHENIFTAEKNAFRAFLVDGGEFGWTIQDYMLEVLDGVTPQWVAGEYTDAEQAQNLVKDYVQNVSENFHYKPFRRQFPTTVRDYEYKKSFYPSKINAFIDRKIGMLNTSAEIYLQNEVLIDEIKDMLENDDIVKRTGFSVNTSNGILTLLEQIKADYTGFSQPNDGRYNVDRKQSITPDDDLKYIIIKASTLERIKVREYSGAFNLEQMRLDGRIIIVPESFDFGTFGEADETPLAFLMDRRSMVIAIKMWKMGTFYVANQYKTNHWLGIEGIRGHNRFINAVAYLGQAPANFT